MTSSMLASDRDIFLAKPGEIAPGGAESIYKIGQKYIRNPAGSLAGVSVSVSISGKEWRFPPEIQVDDTLKEAAGGSLLLSKLLTRRGIHTAADAEIFLHPDKYSPSSPMELPDMPRAIMRVSQAIAQKEHITIYGDYDVDGVTGTAVLVSVLRKIGADVDFYIPNRDGEGYGLNLKAISILASKRRTKLLITCDCGVGNFAEVNFARSLGVDTIVTDHHTMPEMLPPAVAILHPKRLTEEHPLWHLPGVGVAYKLCEALLLDRGCPDEIGQLLDFVTLGMIADLVPLVRENRYLVQIGLPRLVESSRPGLKALLSQVKMSGGTDMVGFGLAPRINAVGRLSDATTAVELMLTDDTATAEKIAAQLKTENLRRQELCDQIFHEAEQMLAQRSDLSTSRAIVIYKEGWHHGVVGIVASRLVDKYHRPVFIGELDPDEKIVRGSARGVDGIDIYEVLKANEQLLNRWGGHKAAAGFALDADKAETFVRAITATCNQLLSEQSLRAVLELDAVLAPSEMSMELVRQLSKLAPFGMGNKKPLLSMRRLVCTGSRALGKEGKHSRIILRDPDSKSVFESVMWNSKGRIPPDNQMLDVAFNAEINSYNGQDKLQLMLSDWMNVNGDEGKKSSLAASVTNPQQSGFLACTSEPVVELAVGQEWVATASRDLVIADSGSSAVDNSGTPAAVRTDRLATTNITWKDLRDHSDAEALLQAASRKLGAQLAVFNETLSASRSATFVDRTTIGKQSHLLLWQYPPSAQLFKTLIEKSGARHIYLLRSQAQIADNPSEFLRKLTGLVRFAINKRDGLAQGDKLGAALGTTKMAIALGLTILRKLNVIDWFAEDGWIHLDLLDNPLSSAEKLSEFRQLASCLADIHEFRRWCAEGSLKELQLSVTPNQIDLSTWQGAPRRAVDELQDSRDNDDTIGAVAVGAE